MSRKLLWTVVVIVLVGIGVAVRFRPRRPAPIVAAATTRPTTRPTTEPVKPKKPAVATYLDAVRSANPAVAATQPLSVPVELPDAAHVVLHDPVYVDQAGLLWITRPDGRPAVELLEQPPDAPEYVVRERPLFVHWGQIDGRATGAVIVARPPHGTDAGGLDLITAAGRQPLGPARPYRWAAAYSIPQANNFVVPTDVGVSVFDVALGPVDTIEPKTAEHYHPLVGCGSGTNPPLTLPDSRGFLAFAPWDGGRLGSTTVARYVDGQWTDLPLTDWPERMLLACVLLDGGVLRIATVPPDPDAVPPPHAPPSAPPSDRVFLTIDQLDPATTAIDQRRVAELVGQLSDPDPDRRRAASDELGNRYGPAVCPVLDRLKPDQPPEGQLRIDQLLRDKVRPALGGMALLDDRLTIAHREPDGTALVFAPAGVRLPTTGADERIVPAWLVVRPDGRVSRPLPPSLVADQRPDACTLRPAGPDEWLAVDAAGPRRYFGTRFVPMLTAPAERRFTDFVALAARRRWVFRDPRTGDTLLIDPMIADPTPKLPTWTIDAHADGQVGWDDGNNPALARGASTADDGTPINARRVTLGPAGWLAMPANAPLHVELLAPPEPATAPATGPTTGPTTIPADGPLLLRSPDGKRYYDGRDAVVTVDPAGRRARWPLPAVAAGSPDVTPVLLRTDDGLLFLFNAPGRLLRLRPTPADAQPFKLDATFTAGIPDDVHPNRVWLDPAGRIDFTTDDHVLTVTFPTGRVPKPIAEMMPADVK